MSLFCKKMLVSSANIKESLSFRQFLKSLTYIKKRSGTPLVTSRVVVERIPVYFTCYVRPVK